MRLEIRPEPDEAEREAILAVLAAEPEAPSPYESGWRRSGLEEELDEA